jgi:hypothetical protein
MPGMVLSVVGDSSGATGWWAVPPAASLISGELKSTSAVVRAARVALPSNWCR